MKRLKIEISKKFKDEALIMSFLIIVQAFIANVLAKGSLPTDEAINEILFA